MHNGGSLLLKLKDAEKPQLFLSAIVLLIALVVKTGGIAASLDVTITTERDRGDGYKPFIKEEHINIDFLLGTEQLPVWGINQRISYTLILTPTKYENSGEEVVPSEISFDPTVEDWDDIELDLNINI